jgi:hypothetical protein
VKVYLTSAGSADADSLADLLRAADLQTVRTDDVGSAQGWLSSLDATLSDCVGVVAFVDPPVSEAVLLEIGVAVGRGLPVVLLMESEADRAELPIAVRELPAFVIGGTLSALANRLNFAFRQPRATPRRSESSSADTTFPAMEWRSTNGSLTEADAAQLVAGAFAAAGARIHLNLDLDGADRRHRADLAAWVPDLLEPAFNPVIVEIQRDSDAETRDQVETYLNELGLFIGLIVTIADREPTWQIDRHAIGTIGVAQLSGLTSADLLRFLRTGRNRLVHTAR